MAALGALPKSVVCRHIEDCDKSSVIDCLRRGFPSRSCDYWQVGFQRLAGLPQVPGCPEYGYVLACRDRIVGVLLTIFAHAPTAEGKPRNVRCNLSSLAVDADYRPYAAKLAAAAMRHAGVTYTNISPTPATLRAAEAGGFKRFSEGLLLFAPVASGSCKHSRITPYDPAMPEAALLGAGERELLSQHAALGCLCLVCTEGSGRAVPLVLVRRRVAGGLVPCQQVVYCRSLDDLRGCAGTLGRFLLTRGDTFCLVDANGPVEGLKGRFFPNIGPKYYKGPCPPAPGDLAFSEIAVFGP